MGLLSDVFYNNRKAEAEKTPVPEKKKNRAPLPSPGQQFRASKLEQMNSAWYSRYRSFLTSPNTDVRRQLHITREISRELVQKDAFANKWYEFLAVYTVGDDGMQVFPRIKGPDGELDDELNQRLKDEWEKWAEHACSDGVRDFTDMEHLGVRTMGRDGETFFRIIREPKHRNRWGVSIYPLDATLLDIEYNQQLTNGNSIVMGVEYENVRPVAYHFRNRHGMDDILSEEIRRERIPADEIIHVFDDDYGSRTRGLPWLTPVIPVISRLHEFMDSYLMACQVAASAPLVMKTGGPPALDYVDDVEVSDEEESSSERWIGRGQSPDEVVDLAYSQVVQLANDADLEALNIQYPRVGFQETVRLYLQQIAAGVQMSYQTLSSDGSRSSFSSVRHDSIHEREHWSTIRAFYAKRFHTRVFREWLRQAMAAGRITLPPHVEVDDVDVDFIPKGFQQIDLNKDILAYERAVQNGFLSRTHISALMGLDIREVLKEIKSERELAEEYGIRFPEAQDQQESDAEAENLLSQADLFEEQADSVDDE